MKTQKQKVTPAPLQVKVIKKTIEPKSVVKVSAQNGGVVKTIWQLLTKNPKMKAKEISVLLAAKHIEHSMNTCYRQRWEFARASATQKSKMMK